MAGEVLFALPHGGGVGCRGDGGEGRVASENDELAGNIETFIAREMGADSVRVSELRRLTGGASRETWSLDAAVERGGVVETLALILQRDVRGAAKSLSRLWHIIFPPEAIRTMPHSTPSLS